MHPKLALTIWLLLAVGLTACASQKFPASDVTPEPPAPPRSEEQANMAYSSEFTGSGSATLVDGEYRAPAGPGSATEIVVRLTDDVAYGDLNGQPSAAVVLVSSGGGSGSFYTLHAVQTVDGEPTDIASTLLGDRIQVGKLAIEDNLIVVDMITQGPDDPMCCPTQTVVQAYALVGSQLEMTSTRTADGE